MTDQDQKQLGKTLWNIADTLRGAMNADDFRDYMLSFWYANNPGDAAQTQKLNALKTHKKWLMQRLFPAQDEEGA